MKFLAVIPARGGSKGIPKKNIKALGGRPLIAYTVEAALASIVDRVIVSTDCEEVALVSRRLGAEVMIRSSALSGDTTPTLPVLQDVLVRAGEKFDAVVTLQPTSPLRTVSNIDESLKLFSGDVHADSLVSVVEVPHNFVPEKLMKLAGNYLETNPNIKRRQDVERLYARNGAAIYITKTQNLSAYIVGGKIIPYFMSKLNSLDIDDMDDWVLAEKLLGR